MREQDFKMEVEDIMDNVINDLKEKGFQFQHNYINGEDGYWGFDKDFSVEVVIKINQMPDEEDIEQFKEDLELVDEKQEVKADLKRKDGK